MGLEAGDQMTDILLSWSWYLFLVEETLNICSPRGSISTIYLHESRMKLLCYCRYRIDINKVLNYICRMDIRIRIKIENIQLFIDGGKSILYLQIQ